MAVGEWVTVLCENSWCCFIFLWVFFLYTREWAELIFTHELCCVACRLRHPVKLNLLSNPHQEPKKPCCWSVRHSEERLNVSMYRAAEGNMRVPETLVQVRVQHTHAFIQSQSFTRGDRDFKLNTTCKTQKLRLVNKLTTYLSDLYRLYVVRALSRFTPSKQLYSMSPLLTCSWNHVGAERINK